MTEYPRDEISQRGGDPEAISDRYRDQKPDSISVSWTGFLNTIQNEDTTIEYINAIQETLATLKRRKRERDTVMPISALWETDAQQQLITEYAFAIPTREALDYLIKQGPLVELGAWTGYWAYELDKRSGDITAYDIDPILDPWFPVQSGDQDVLLEYGKAETLVLCWPPVGPMAYESLLLHDGDVIYIGERPGEGFKAFGDMRFFDVLDARYEHVTQIDLPSHPGAKDNLHHYRPLD
ncbi:MULTISPECIES: hypothetical protein [Halarchaeum]|uniref:Uncharacterized protein n=2 Tax=Halarchaeum TaxID=744724 RepID=U3AG06_9EURY|nr:hypothetical protein [Halarchaeum acidiphilum]GAD53728.1 hypothetical protein MBEHAL_2488 [Halarchaeum acidiphilum MH1-52-1]